MITTKGKKADVEAALGMQVDSWEQEEIDAEHFLLFDSDANIYDEERTEQDQ